MSNSLGIAVIGAGMVGRAHAAGYRTASQLYDLDLPEIRLVAVADAHEPFAVGISPAVAHPDNTVGNARFAHDPALQSRVFKLLGIDDKTAELRFGFLLEGLRAGAPPHGGVAFGFENPV